MAREIQTRLINPHRIGLKVQSDTNTMQETEGVSRWSVTSRVAIKEQRCFSVLRDTVVYFSSMISGSPKLQPESS